MHNVKLKQSAGRTTIWCSNFDAGASAALLFLAPNYPTLLTGRVIYGLGIGFAMHAAPAYIAETAPASVRGLLIRYVPKLGSIFAEGVHTRWLYLQEEAKNDTPLVSQQGCSTYVCSHSLLMC